MSRCESLTTSLRTANVFSSFKNESLEDWKRMRIPIVIQCSCSPPVPLARPRNSRPGGMAQGILGIQSDQTGRLKQVEMKTSRCFNPCKLLKNFS